MKKALCFLLSLLLLTALLSGCAGKPAAVGQVANEIFTYKKLDPEKTTLVVSRTGNIYIDTLSEEFERLNPDVQVVSLDITGGNIAVTPAKDWLLNGLAPDIMFWQGGLISDELLTEYFKNLSTSPLAEDYQAEALSSIAIDDNLYCLPCPSDVACMLYNKTLFEQYGWKVPATFDEFIAVCDQITADTNGEVQPWNPNAKYADEFSMVMQGFFYEELFAGVDNRKWYDAAMNGTTGTADHLRPMYDAVQTLIDHGILREEYFSYSATARLNEFRTGQIAMINFKAMDIDSDDYEFGMMSFPGTVGELGYVCKYYNAVVGVPKAERTEAVQNAIDRYLAYFSSEEGQRVYISDSLQISNVKNVNPPESSALSALQSVMDKGHEFQLLSFSGENPCIQFKLIDDAKLMYDGEKTAADCIAAIDAAPSKSTGSTEPAAPATVATAEKDFTILETSFYMADMYREAAGADIGLIPNNIAYHGNLMRIFAGALIPDHVTVLMPRSLGNGTTLVKASMTGRQLLDALNDPVGPGDQTGDCVYAFSGLKCKIAPWNPQGERMLSVTLSNGEAIDPDAMYTVAFWSGTVFDKYITGDAETVEGSWTDLMTAKLQGEGTIAPADDGRITLVWE